MRGQSRYKETVNDALRTASGPLSATDLHTRLRHTGIGIATVYRVLRKGLEDGELACVELPGGPKRYKPADQACHHHFECVECHTVYDVKGSFDGLDHLIPEGFELEQHEIILSGRCRECAKTASKAG